MDAAAEDFTRSDVDAEMTVLTPEDVTEPNPDAADEVENLRNSLREAVHDDNVRPKMQCLMMDSSFSMVTMQGEDSGIAWETTASRCTTPWTSETGTPTVDLNSPFEARAAKPGSVPAGKIIFVMDEELMSRPKKPKERATGQKKLREVFEGCENVSGRPELVEFSEPNVKNEEEGAEEEASDPQEDKEQRLFRLVSEGSEILNIVVPPKLVTVDEEESKEMVDNLSYLEESPLPKASIEIIDNEPTIPTDAPTVSLATRTEEINPIRPQVMDPPGAPVARPPGRRATGNVDYLEPFTLITTQAPGGPDVIMQEPVEPQEEETPKSEDTEQPEESNAAATATATAKSVAVDNDISDTVSLEEITCDLLDEVFYGGTEDYVPKSLGVQGGAGEDAPSRLPSKPSGSNLFGSQEEILTPIFLPEGPPKIIDLILLEEPKAMAFLYDDLYEEAIGSRQKDEDAESMTSEKSFHSRHSDREARGYLEKYVLIDETPVVESEPTVKEKAPEGPRTLTQDLYDFHFMSKPEKGEMATSDEEVTDFFRSSGNSSPCDIEPFPRSLEEDDGQTATKSKAKTNKSVSIKVEQAAEPAADPLTISSFEFPSDEPDWEITDDHPVLGKGDIGTRSDQKVWRQDTETQKPVAPLRKKAASSPKSCLDLTPLIPVDVDVAQEEEENADGKEQREEEKETASPAETADEGDGNGQEVSTSDKETESRQTESDEVTSKDAEPTVDEEKDAKVADETETTSGNVESENVEVHPEKQTAEPAKGKGQCIIL